MVHKKWDDLGISPFEKVLWDVKSNDPFNLFLHIHPSTDNNLGCTTKYSPIVLGIQVQILNQNSKFD